MRGATGKQARKLGILTIVLVWMLAIVGCGGTAGAVPDVQVRLTVNVAEMENARGARDGECGRVRIDEGAWGTNRSILVDPGTQATIEAAAEEGWEFEGWYLGQTRVSENPTYQVEVNFNQTFTATFSQPDQNVTFWMGNTREDVEGGNDEEPVHGVTFQYEYWIDTYEVSFEQYDAYCADVGVPNPEDEGWGREDRPVIHVDWWGAIAYCNWLSEQQGFSPAYDENTGSLLDGQGNTTTDITRVEGYRLPTEAEWEFAARGAAVDIDEGEETNDFKYAGSNSLGNVGWYGTNSGGTSHPVGEKDPNECGLFDMSGNVYEWCHDRYGEDYYAQGSQQNPIGPSSGSERVVRGGCWFTTAEFCRVAERAGHDPQEGDKYLGFRLAQTTMYTITAQSDPENGGDVRINGGAWSDDTSVSVASQGQVTLEADPANGWEFDGWYDGFTKVSTSNPYQLVATKDQTYTAQFLQSGSQYTITAQSEPQNGGDVRINGGAWGDEKSANVAGGSEVTVQAQAETGWEFSGWYEGSTQVHESAIFQFTAAFDRTLTAKFQQQEEPPEITFYMGNTRGDAEGLFDELPVHGVIFTYDFWLSPYEVTFDQYDAYCDDTGADKPSDRGWGRGTRPVIHVSWFDAISYCNWRSEQEGYAVAYDSSGNLLDRYGNVTNDLSQVQGYRLPTEAEWEYSARGGSEDIASGVEEHDYKYAGSNTLSSYGWYSGNSGEQTHPVGQKLPNEQDLFDMSGNVWEWCHDWFSSYWYEEGTMTDPTGPSSGYTRVYRSGGWNRTAAECRVADRGCYVPDLDGYDLGFRLARTQ
ncbi:MAG TPA: SUMF1/EgtB/PvdO family nonheme iron enzyme [Thermotogota bacterium]|nr:SUMF1/EgtB/PvdO family nonheme iron enzyme [Thermotogota bacterium]HRW93743.1 SUMF1/EgtB/PvdO family nonheme iron enzyme [Thermotogota bacterium]